MFGPLIRTQTAFDFITVSGVLVLAFMVCLEYYRVTHPKSDISILLTRSFQPVLDKKDSAGSIITSHMELLIAAIGPVWLRSISESPLFHEQVILMSGLVTVGVGDSLAAIVGISLPQVHRIAKTGKSFEGSVAFLISVCLCFLVIEGGSLSFAAFTASVAATLTECFVRNHDNIAIPSVFLFVYYLAQFVVYKLWNSVARHVHRNVGITISAPGDLS
jgi:dolichol kinase